MNQAYGAMRWLAVAEVAVGIDVFTPATETSVSSVLQGGDKRRDV